jgi:hypothetical protein
MLLLRVADRSSGEYGDVNGRVEAVAQTLEAGGVMKLITIPEGK